MARNPNAHVRLCAACGHRHDARTPHPTTWAPCRWCGATTRHDGGLCYRDVRHPRTDPRLGFGHSPSSPDLLERLRLKGAR